MQSLASICCLSLAVLVVVGQVVPVRGVAVSGTRGNKSKRPVFLSEMKLRSVIEQTNNDLRQLKRDFMEQMTDIYLKLKLDTQMGYDVATQARQRDPRSGAPLGATMNMLIAEQFGEIVVKRYVIQRRLLTGLKLAFVKFLPMKTLVLLYQRYKSFEWLRDQSQVDLRPKFPNMEENQYVLLYSLIELRARLRAADDVIILTSGNIMRILQVIQYYLIESKHKSAEEKISQHELELLARHASRVVRYYQEQILEYKTSLRKSYESILSNSEPLVDSMLLLSSSSSSSSSSEQTSSHESSLSPINQDQETSMTVGQMVARVTVAETKPTDKQQLLFQFVDNLINTEALDIDLSIEANGLEFPPTINEQMIDNIQAKWIPDYVLKSIDEDRQLLIDERSKTKQFVKINEDYEGADISEWISYVLGYICRNLSTHHGQFLMFRR